MLVQFTPSKGLLFCGFKIKSGCLYRPFFNSEKQLRFECSNNLVRMWVRCPVLLQAMADESTDLFKKMGRSVWTHPRRPSIFVTLNVVCQRSTWVP